MKAIRRVVYAIVFFMVAGYAFVTLRGPNGVHALVDKQVQIQEMEKRNAQLAKEIEAKREHIQRLNDDPAAQELEIKERLKLARPGEKIYIIGDPKK